MFHQHVKITNVVERELSIVKYRVDTNLSAACHASVEQSTTTNHRRQNVY